MGDYTAMEKSAVADARMPLWDALVAEGTVTLPRANLSPHDTISVSDVFAELNEQQIDRIISAVWDGLRASMQKQSGMGEIPF